MGMSFPASTLEKIRRGEPLDEAEVRYVRAMVDHAARYALPLPALLGITAAILGLLVFLTIEVALR